MFDALRMSNFCCAVYLRWNEHCGQFSASCNIKIQKKRYFFFHKQALNHVWCTLYVQFLLCCLFEIKLTLWTVFRKLQHWNTENTFFSINKSSKSCLWCTLDVQFLLCCLFEIERNIVDSFQQVATLKYRKSFFSINKL